MSADVQHYRNYPTEIWSTTEPQPPENYLITAMATSAAAAVVENVREKEGERDEVSINYGKKIA